MSVDFTMFLDNLWQFFNGIVPVILPIVAIGAGIALAFRFGDKLGSVFK